MIYTHKDGIQKFSNSDLRRQARFLPRDKFPFNTGIAIAPNHSIRMFSFKKGFIGVWIDNAEMANTLKFFFDICWEFAQKEK